MTGILIDDNSELVVRMARDGNGMIAQGLAVGNIGYQRCRIIITAQKGELKERPTLGFGIDRRLKSPGDRQQFVAELAKELRSDGMSSARVTLRGSLAEFEVTI